MKGCLSSSCRPQGLHCYRPWFAQSHQGASPYRLYALSNVGSLLALVTYPFVVEPELTLKAQAIVWSLLFVAFAIGVGLCGLNLARTADSSVHSADTDLSLAPSQVSAPTRASYALWIAVGCSRFPDVALPRPTKFAREVAVVNAFLVGASTLAIYLLSFIICFDSERWYQRGIFHPALRSCDFPEFRIILCRSTANIFFLKCVVYCVLLAAVCMVCHGELVKLKPVERYLTSFYLMIAIGGALGGILAAVIAPKVFASATGNSRSQFGRAR